MISEPVMSPAECMRLRLDPPKWRALRRPSGSLLNIIPRDSSQAMESGASCAKAATTAYDQSGNESPPSDAAEATLP